MPRLVVQLIWACRLSALLPKPDNATRAERDKDLSRSIQTALPLIHRVFILFQLLSGQALHSQVNRLRFEPAGPSRMKHLYERIRCMSLFVVDVAS